MFVCTKCDAQSSKWSGRCLECGGWGTVMEESEIPRDTKASPAPRKGKDSGRTKPRASTSLAEASGPSSRERLATNNTEVDRVLCGGFVPGSLVLLSGEPGIGKSTLVAQIASAIASPIQSSNRPTLQPPSVIYLSGEESAQQLADRFKRLQAPMDRVRFLEPFPVETVIATLETEKPIFAVIDSIQTLSSDSLESSAGSPNMVRYATGLLLDLAKRTGIAVLLVGQVTKDGAVAGPKTLEHLVDAVLTLEGDPSHAYRLLRATKNRVGSTDEVGVFEMTAGGLAAVENPSAKFLEERAAVPGSVVTATIEGSRVFLVEVQALVEKSAYGMPVRRASGFDQNRLQMLTAILSKRGGLKLADQDVYVNVIGGMSLHEPAADLAICAAIASAARNTANQEPILYVGEVGLGGEVRSVPFLERRIGEAKRLGIVNAVVPKKSLKPTDTGLSGITSISQL